MQSEHSFWYFPLSSSIVSYLLEPFSSWPTSAAGDTAAGRVGGTARETAAGAASAVGNATDDDDDDDGYNLLAAAVQSYPCKTSAENLALLLNKQPKLAGLRNQSLCLSWQGMLSDEHSPLFGPAPLLVLERVQLPGGQLRFLKTKHFFNRWLPVMLQMVLAAAPACMEDPSVYYEFIALPLLCFCFNNGSRGWDWQWLHTVSPKQAEDAVLLHGSCRIEELPQEGFTREEMAGVLTEMKASQLLTLQLLIAHVADRDWCDIRKDLLGGVLQPCLAIIRADAELEDENAGQEIAYCDRLLGRAEAALQCAQLALAVSSPGIATNSTLTQPSRERELAARAVVDAGAAVRLCTSLKEAATAHRQRAKAARCAARAASMWLRIKAPWKEPGEAVPAALKCTSTAAAARAREASAAFTAAEEEGDREGQAGSSRPVEPEYQPDAVRCAEWDWYLQRSATYARRKGLLALWLAGRGTEATAGEGSD